MTERSIPEKRELWDGMLRHCPDLIPQIDGMPVKDQARMQWAPELDNLVSLVGAATVDEVCRDKTNGLGFPALLVNSKSECERLEAAVVQFLRKKAKR